MTGGLGALLLIFSLQGEVQRSNAVVLTALQRLHELSTVAPAGADRRTQIANLNAEVEKVMQPLDTRQLVQLALASHSMVSGLAEHEAVDEVYRSAFWLSARRLADDPGSEAELGLARLAERSGIDDGGDLLMIRELLARQVKKREAARTKH